MIATVIGSCRHRHSDQAATCVSGWQIAPQPTRDAAEAGCWQQAVCLACHRPLRSLEHRSQDAAVLPGGPLPMGCCRCAAPRAAAPLPAVWPRCCRQGVLQPLMLGAECGACAPYSMLHCSTIACSCVVLDQLHAMCRLPGKLTTWCVLLTALRARKPPRISMTATPSDYLTSAVPTHTCKQSCLTRAAEVSRMASRLLRL